MSYYIDVKYLKLVSVRIDGFTQKNQELFQCKCFFCGDSQKKKSKKRGYFYKKANNLFYRCFNCEASTTLYKVLQHLNPSLAKEYQLERFAQGGSKHGNFEKPKFQFKKPVFKKKVGLDIPTISSLDADHYAKEYIIDRKIPKGLHKDIYFAVDFKQFVLSIKPDYDKKLIDRDPRIVIPFRDENGDIFAIQGRALNKNPLRYITVKLEDKLKLFGLDRIDKKETIYCVEGPFDSMFIKNCVATADSNLMIASEVFDKEKLVLISDNEPRNAHIVKQISKQVDAGFNVCLLPESFPGKDINEAILNGLTKPQLKGIIDDNTYNGLRAKIEFNRWKKV